MFGSVRYLGRAVGAVCLCSIVTGAGHATLTATAARDFGDVFTEAVFCTAIDENGNLFLAGTFENTINLGGSTLSSVGGIDMFVAKFNSSGDHVWSTSGGGSDSDLPNDIAIDSAGNLIVVGSMDSSDAMFGGSPLASVGGFDAFIVKYGSLGVHRWSQRFGDTLSDSANGVDVASDGRIIMAGTFNGSVDFGTGPLTSSGFADVFACLMDPDGAVTGAIRHGGTSTESVNGVAFDSSDNFLICGGFYDTTDLGSGPHTSAGETDIYLAKYAADTAMPLWSRSFGGDEFDEVEAITTGALGSIFIAGRFGDVVNFGGGGIGSAGLSDGFAAAYAAGGTHVWSTRFGGPGEDTAMGIDVSDAAVAIAGYYEDEADFGPFVLESEGSIDAFILELGPLGGYHCVGSGGGSSIDAAYDVAIGDDGVVMAGVFDGPAWFGDIQLNGIGLLDAFLVKYSEPAVSVEPAGASTESNVWLSLSGPNPVRSGARFDYRHDGSSARLEIFDIQGRVVHREALGAADDGQTTTWNGNDVAGRAVPDGVYFVRLTQGAFHTTQRLSLIRN